MRQPQFAFSSNGGIIGEAEQLLSRTRAKLAPAQPMLRILDNSDPLAKLAAIGCKDSWSVQSHML